MASLSEEILKLSELFANGVLSEEEFKAAKEVTIKRYTPPATITPYAEKPGGGSEKSEDFAVSSQINTREFGDDAASQTQREQAYGILETILNNLIQFPTHEKYRRLRLTNPVLHSQLFSVPGVKEFLKSLGFVELTSESGGGVNEDGEWMQLPEAPHRSLLDEGMNAIRSLRSRDQNKQANARECMRLRRELSLEVRRERCEKAKAVGELRSFIVQEFCSDDAGDGLYSSLKNLEKLEAVLANVLRYPSEAKYRRLRLSNPAVYAAVLQQRGGMELLAECAGGEVVDEAGEGFLVLREGAVTEGKLRCALQLVEEARAAVRERQAETDRRVREEAREAVRAQAHREREQELRRLRQQQRQAPPELEDANSPEKHQGQRQRIPIADAIRVLMGRNVGPEEDE